MLYMSRFSQLQSVIKPHQARLVKSIRIEMLLLGYQKRVAVALLARLVQLTSLGIDSGGAPISPDMLGVLRTLPLRRLSIRTYMSAQVLAALPLTLQYLHTSISRTEKQCSHPTVSTLDILHYAVDCLSGLRVGDWPSLKRVRFGSPTDCTDERKRDLKARGIRAFYGHDDIWNPIDLS